MHIYPIVKGQPFHERVMIPPRASLSEPAPRPKAVQGNLINLADDCPSALSETRPPPPTQEQEQEQVAVKSPQEKPPPDASRTSTTEIQKMLVSTGAPAKNGPRIDFHSDMRKSLAPTSSKRTESDESHDEDDFVDARD